MIRLTWTSRLRAVTAKVTARKVFLPSWPDTKDNIMIFNTIHINFLWPSVFDPNWLAILSLIIPLRKELQTYQFNYFLTMVMAVTTSGVPMGHATIGPRPRGSNDHVRPPRAASVPKSAHPVRMNGDLNSLLIKRRYVY